MINYDNFWEFYDEDDYPIKKGNRRAKREKIERSKEAFMKLNGRGLISDILPTIGKLSKKEKKGQK